MAAWEAIRYRSRCCSAAVFAARRSRESTVIRACGAYISSQLCSDQKTSFSGAGL